jgi:hypothetical protein
VCLVYVCFPSQYFSPTCVGLFFAFNHVTGLI